MSKLITKMILLWLLLPLLAVVAACTPAEPIPPPDPEPAQTPEPAAETDVADGLLVFPPEEDAAVVWQDPAVEALVREKLGIPAGDIMRSDLDHIWGIELIGSSHIFFNADGGLDMYTDIEGVVAYDRILLNPSKIAFLEDGGYSVNGEQYARGVVANIADFANFRNLRYLHCWFNSLTDLSGLASLTELKELKLIDCNISTVTALAELRQVRTLTYLDLKNNQIENIYPLSELGQLEILYLNDNPIQSWDALKSLVKLKTLNLRFTPLTSADVEDNISHLSLDSLYLGGTLVDDLSAISSMTSLTTLSVENLSADKIDLAPLATLENLQALFVAQDRAELVNWQDLGELKNLQYLFILPSTGLSDEDIVWLQKQLPNCTITE